MSDSEQDRPAQNTRSATSRRAFSVDSRTDSNYPIDDTKGIPKPTFQIPRTPPPQGIAHRIARSHEKVKPCQVILEKLDETELEQIESRLNIDKDFRSEDTSDLYSSTDNLLFDIVEDIPNNKMAKLSVSDMIKAIPVFEGHQKDIDYFISTCTNYHNMIEDNLKPTFISIIVTKFKGIAHIKMQPLSELTTWDMVKTRLEEKFKRPLNYETAQDEIAGIRQARNESIEIYGNHIRLALHKLNRATETLTNNVEALKSLRTANEKLAIKKFEQNLFNTNLKIWVGAKDFDSLDTAISFAMQKEPMNKNNVSNIRCNYCNINGHIESDCRRKQRERNQNNSDRTNNYTRGNDYNRYRQSNSANRSNYGSANNNNSNRNSNDYNNKNGNRSNRWENPNNNNNNNHNTNSIRKPPQNSATGSNNAASNSNIKFPNNRNTTQGARRFADQTNHSLTLAEVLKDDTKN